MLRTCDICFEEFQPKSVKNKRCSDTCRKAQSRLNSLDHYYKDHESNKAKSREATFRLTVEEPLKKMYNACKYRAKTQGVAFEIEISDIPLITHCPVFNVPFERNTQMAMSLDKIDPLKGYVPGNVQLLSRLANLMKNNATPEQLKQFAAWVNRSY